MRLSSKQNQTQFELIYNTSLILVLFGLTSFELSCDKGFRKPQRVAKLPQYSAIYPHTNEATKIER